MPLCLESLFGKNACSAQALKKKEADLKGLSQWISDIEEVIEKEVPALKKAAGRSRHGGRSKYKMAREIDFNSFTHEDLKALRPALEGLHNVCLKANVAVDLSGFELPSSTQAKFQSFSANPKLREFCIFVDARRKYNYAVNPYGERGLQNERNCSPG